MFNNHSISFANRFKLSIAAWVAGGSKISRTFHVDIGFYAVEIASVVTKKVRPRRSFVRDYKTAGGPTPS